MRSLRTVVPALVTLILLTACGGGGGGEPTALPITVSVSPTSSTVDAGGTVTLSATVTNATNSAVTWSATGGTVQGSGASATWLAPATGGTFTITATSVEDATKKASATVTVNTATVSITPATTTLASGATGNFTATVTGAVVTAVTWTVTGGTLGTPSGGSVDWIAPATGGSFTITATSVADPSRSASSTVTVTPVSVSLDPGQATIGAGGTQSITATVAGGVDQGVTWSATGGVINGTGPTITWQGPVTGGSFTITATSVLDPSRSASATLTVTPVVVTITPGTGSLFRGEVTTFNASVTGATSTGTGVTWTASCGTAVPDGATLNYTAPTTIATCTITATSDLDGTKSANAVITVRPEILVSSLNDIVDGTCNFAHCSLREAIVAANASPDASVIMLGGPPAPAVRNGVAAAVPPLNGTLTLTSSLPNIVTPVEIRGPGATSFTIDANAAGTTRRIFTISSGATVTVSGMTLRNARMQSAPAILVESGSTLHLANVGLTGNRATSGPGGAIGVVGGSMLEVTGLLATDNQSATFSGPGGVISVAGNSVASIRNSTFQANQAGMVGGAVLSTTGSTVEIDNTLFDGNTGDAGGAIAAYEKGTIKVMNSVMRNNSANAGGAVFGGAGNWAPVNASTIELTDVTIEDNRANGQGGGIQVVRNAHLTLARTIVRRNRVIAAASGFPVYAGGIMVGDQVDAVIDRSTIADNEVTVANGYPEDGGGGIVVAALGSPTSLVLTNSTVSGNTVARTGGGLYVHNNAVATLENVTISGNTAQTTGGIMALGPATFRNVTVAGNTATLVSGGIGAGTNGSVSLRSVLVSGNLLNAVPMNCATTGSGTITSTSSNLGDDLTCPLIQASDKPNTPAGLGALADNGGLTMTRALLAGSAAIDAGHVASCPAMDQRGAPRAGPCDIGAFEFGATVPAVAPRLTLTPLAILRGRLGPPASAASVAMPGYGDGPLSLAGPGRAR